MKSIEAAVSMMRNHVDIPVKSEVRVRNIILEESSSPPMRDMIRSMTDEELKFYLQVLELTTNPMYMHLNVKSSPVVTEVFGRIMERLDKLDV